MLTVLSTATPEYRDTVSLLTNTTTTDPAHVESSINDALNAINRTIDSGDPQTLAQWATSATRRLDAADVGNLVVAACAAVQKAWMKQNRSELSAISRLLLSARHYVADAIFVADNDRVAVSA